MVQRHGVTGIEQEGIFFTESDLPDAKVIGRVSVEISRQNSNLAAVRTELAAKARALGANAIAGFTYGQKSHLWWEQILTFKWDSESWVGEGKAVRVIER